MKILIHLDVGIPCFIAHGHIGEKLDVKSKNLLPTTLASANCRFLSLPFATARGGGDKPPSKPHFPLGTYTRPSGCGIRLTEPDVGT